MREQTKAGRGEGKRKRSRRAELRELVLDVGCVAVDVARVAKGLREDSRSAHCGHASHTSALTRKAVGRCTSAQKGFGTSSS